MSELNSPSVPIPEGKGSVREQLERAVADLWTMSYETGDDFIVLMDRRRLQARVQRTDDGTYRISWEDEDDDVWREYEGEFSNPREATFHAYQGPH